MDGDHFPAGQKAAIDADHPWLGLDSFSEATRSWFHGRDEEVAELARRVQRKLLTVLFGQSGLGKTSILRAGIVPRLREQGYCPVYVRVDYASGAPSATQQIKQAIVQATAASGNWSQAGIAADDESLWEFLHHRDDVLTDARGEPVLPLLIFDQFEEIFTLAQGDDEGRSRAADFIAGLAELVENRPSPTLEAKLEVDDSAMERFDFARTDYRVLIALREDYLAHLEGLKGDMPSITQNRMRLAPMTGRQALAAVSGPGAALVTDDVAQAIVRFVAGGAELAHAQVEPSLLSLICRELNDKRIAAGRATITLDLLDGSHASILADFYERALADQPAAARAVIEDVLLTESGYRENVAAERLLAAFAHAGAAPGALALLVNRRLLRIEERLDIRRVELTHDVLCGVVGASRAQRHEREAHAATAHRLHEQRELERATRRSLGRTRGVALVCALLAIGAAAASLYAVNVSQRTEQARGQAEELVGYLSDDFARELKGSGRHVVVRELGQRTLAYYNGLPQIARGSSTELNRAMAMINLGITLRFTSELDEADRLFAEADRILRQRASTGDQDEASAVAMARCWFGQGIVAMSRVHYAESATLFQRSAAHLAALATKAGASDAARRAYGQSQVYFSFVEGARLGRRLPLAVDAADAARKVYVSLGALEANDADAAVGHAEADTYGAFALLRLNRNEEGEQRLRAAIALDTKVLAKQPHHFRALESRADAASGLGINYAEHRQIASALRDYAHTLADYLTLTELNPSSANLWWNLSYTYNSIGQLYLQAGQTHDASRHWRLAADAAGRPEKSTPALRDAAFDALSALSALYADQGEHAQTEAVLERAQAVLEQAEGEQKEMQTLQLTRRRAAVALLAQDLGAARALAQQGLAQVAKAKAVDATAAADARQARYRQLIQLGMIEYTRGDDTAAEHALKDALAVATGWFVDSLNAEQAERTNATVWLALAQARQGRMDEARTTLSAPLARSRELARGNRDDQLARLDFAVMLYAHALSDPAARTGALREAAALVAALPAEMRKLRSVNTWRARIASAMQG